MVFAAIVLGLFGLLALWTVVNPKSVYWALTAWQYKDPDANEPSDVSYGISRLAAMVTLAILVIFGFQATGWQAEAQAREDCKTVLLPALRAVVRSKPVTPSALEDFARVHGLTVKVSTIRVPTYPTTRRTTSPRQTSATPSATGTSKERPSAGPTPTPSPTSTPTPTPSRTTARPPAATAITTYYFQRQRTTVLSWTDGSSYWGPNPACKV